MVGGEINYRCLGNDRYEITVTVFRDCDTGVPWFDDPASVGVFDNNDSLLYDLRLRLRNNDTLDLNLADPCLVAPPNVCIHTTTYIDTVMLPFQAGGYQIVYQRCCRNQDIVNIVAPTSTGATYSSFISEAALLSCNSSARFVEWPPVYICAGVPIAYDHSAVDPDGDSVVYELCTPFTGATAAQSMPQPPNNPPYNNVTWQPPYSVDNMLGGPDSLIIDPVTGLLTGTPDIIGVFVVGVCAKEYRNGQLISTTRRDFQYVVGVCGRVVSSAFFAPNIQCDNSLIVNFQNNSSTLGTGYQWYFGDPLNPNPSTFTNPSYIYPDTGRYTVTLIADPGTLCADTSQQEIYLQYQSLDVDFDVQTANCTDSFYLDVTDLSIDSISSIARWYWDFGNGLTDTIPFTSTVYDSSGTYIIRLDVMAVNGCTDSYEDTLRLDLPTIFGNDTLGICPGDTAVVLNPGGNPNHRYQWSPVTGLSSAIDPSPTAFLTGNSPITYSVTVTAPNGLDTCRLERRITVLSSPPFSLQLTPDTITCLDSIALVANSPQAVRIEWTTDPTFGTLFFVGDSLYTPVTGATRFFVRAFNTYGCTIVDTVDVFKSTEAILPHFSATSASCTPLGQVQFMDQTTGSVVQSWLWIFGDGDSSRIQNPLHTYAQSGGYEVVLRVMTNDGCTGEVKDSIYWQVPRLAVADSVGLCLGDSGVVLNTGGNPSLHYQWSPSASLSSATAASPFATPPMLPFNYTVTITAINGQDTCIEVETLRVLASPPISVAVPPVTVYCGDSVTLLANSPTAVFFDWALDANFGFIVATGNPIRVQPFAQPLSRYFVRATNAYGCTSTAVANVQQNISPVNVDFTYQSLGCSETIGVQFNDVTIDSANNPITTWLWTTSDGQSSSLQNPRFTFQQSGSVTVTLQVTLADGCTASKDELLDFNLAQLVGDTALIWCDGVIQDTLNRGGNPNLQYRWGSTTGSLSSLTVASPLATVISPPALYTVTMTGYGSLDTCVSVQRIMVNRAPPILIEVPKDTVICGGAFNIRANIPNASAVDWSFSPTFNPVVLRNITNFFIGVPPPPYDLFVYVRATDAYGCTATDTAKVLRRDIPIPVSFTTQINNCVDTLDAVFTNTTAFPTNLQLQGYTWDLGNGQFSYTTNAAARYLNTLNPVVRLTATATNGCVGTFVDTLIHRLPRLYGMDSIGLCQNDSVQLNQGGDSLLLYQWSPTVGLSDPNSPSPWVAPTVNTLYTVTMTSPNGGDTCVGIHTVWVNVDPFELNAMADTVLCDNRISLRAGAPSGSVVEWSLDRNFTQLVGAGNPFVTAINDPRWFYVRTTNTFGCYVEDSVLVRYLGEGLQVALDWQPLQCGDSLLVQWQGRADSSVQQWTWNLGNGQSSTLQNPAGLYVADSVYTVQLSVQGVGNCVGSATRDLVVALPRLAFATDSLLLCGGDTTRLGLVGRPDLRYQWTPSTGLSDPTVADPLFGPNQTTTYRLRVTGSVRFGTEIDSCWVEDTIRVVVSPAPSVALVQDTVTCDTSLRVQLQFPNSTNQYRWSFDRGFGTLLSTQTQTIVAVTPTRRWVYVQATDSVGCAAVDSLPIQSQGLALSLDNTIPQCDTQTLLIPVRNTGAAATNYVWSPTNVIQAGQGSSQVTVFTDTITLVTVVGSNTFGCTDTAQTQVIVAPPLDLTVSDDTLVCDTTVLVLLAQSSAAQSYSWSDRVDMSTVLGQNSQYTTNVVNSIDVYYIQVADAFGCTALDSVLLEYRPAAIELEVSSTTCTGSQVQLLAQNLNTLDQLVYQWSPSGRLLSGQGTAQVTVPVDSGFYQLQVTNQYGCVTSDSIAVTPPVSSQLGLVVQADQDTVGPGTVVQLWATQHPNYQYDWSVGVNNSSVYNPTVTLSQTTTFYVTITDDQGCSLVDSVVVFVQTALCEEPYVFVPNAFSPDGDGYNDVIYVKGNHLTDVNFVIYDRWGERVFETQQLGAGWDGRYRGKASPPDVYAYYLECRCLDGTRLIKKGNITLLR